MPYKPLDEKTVGFISVNGEIKAACLSFEKGGFQVKRLFCFPLQQQENVKPLYNEEKELQKFCDENLSVATLNASDVLVRRLKMKLIKEKDIEEAFLFQAEPELPYPLETALLDKIIVEKEEDSTLLAFLAVKKEYLEKTLSFWKEHGIDPEIVSSMPIALNALLNAASEPNPLQFVVYVGNSTTLSVLLKEGKLLASHSVPIGWSSLNGETDLLNPHPSPDLKKSLDELLQAILWNYLSLIKETRSKEEPVLYITGEGANIPHLTSLISTTLGLKTGSLSNFNGTIKPEELNRFAIPIGLALSAQPKDILGPAIGINFRQEEFSYKTPWKRFKKSLSFYAGLALLAAASLYLLGSNYLAYKEDLLKTQFLDLLTFTQKPYDAFESSYEKKYPQTKQEEGILPIQSLDSEAISRRIDFLENEIKSMPDTFPLLPNIPRVSDVLVWLSNHPKIICEETKSSCPPFTINIFHYQLVKRPEINKKTERYQVKIDLEFSTSSPRLAREFHDTLITANDFVDPKSEIKWTATKGKYRTSFYLKDKTVYP